MTGEIRERVEFGCLAGIRVIDLGHLVAGPMAAGLLADHGADVVKVERPGQGDAIRRLGVHPHKGNAPLWWKVANRNKRAIALDFDDAGDMELLLRLISETDILITNFSPAILTKYEIDYERLRRVNQSLVMLTTTGFGLTGPHRERRGFGRTAEAFSGFAYTTGFPDGPPMHAGFPVADCLGALMGAFAVMAAVYERANNPDSAGQHIDLGLHETPFRIMDLIAVQFDQLGVVTGREGTANSYVSPSGTWKTRDGRWLSFTGSTQAMVERFFTALDREDLISDPRFGTHVSRLEGREELDRIIADWMSIHTLAKAVEVLEAHGVAVSTYMNIEDIFSDPHYEARGDIISIEDDEVGMMRMPAALPFFSRTPGRVVHTGPAINAHRREVLADWLGDHTPAEA